ncbi:MAG TPA: MBL fold metallo-hydrolase [Blastocatellia bacterium]|nr:MBL fold metallo-hydrolase [Blastocatellia bacterium]
MRLILLGSGSSGNALYVESGATSVLVDVGLSAKETARRLSEAGIDAARLTAIVVTHEHADHVKGVRVMSKTAEVPVFISDSTREECRFAAGGSGMQWGEMISSSRPFQIGSLDFHPFTIPHDGIDTFAFTVESCGAKVGIVTDLGYITQLVAERLKGCNLVVIESNHDRDMLKVGPYPWPLKQRIASNTGHLSNDETARWLREDFDGRAEYLVLAHLSRQCNHPELARLSALQALATHGSLFFPDAERRVKIAHQDRPTQWFEL